MVRGLREHLADNLVGIYLQGSFAVGGYDEHSDVDFIVVLERDITDDELGRLQDLHRRVFDLPSEWAKHLEGSYFPKSVLATVQAAGSPVWYLDHGARTLVRSDHCNTVVVRVVLREYGVSLLGPDPDQLVDPIVVTDLQRDILATIHDWGRDILENPARYTNRFYQGFIILNYCRMLHDLSSGIVGSNCAVRSRLL
ncbi:MAG: nucleotidyltransferase domain-containing protein [Longimicrobiales bacterium]